MSVCLTSRSYTCIYTAVAVSCSLVLFFSRDKLTAQLTAHSIVNSTATKIAKREEKKYILEKICMKTNLCIRRPTTTTTTTKKNKWKKKTVHDSMASTNDGRHSNLFTLPFPFIAYLLSFIWFDFIWFSVTWFNICILHALMFSLNVFLFYKYSIFVFFLCFCRSLHYYYVLLSHQFV